MINWVLICSLAFIRLKLQKIMNVQEAESIFFKKVHPGEEHHSASGGLVDINELGTQHRELREETVKRLM